MKKSISAALTATLCATSFAAVAQTSPSTSPATGTHNTMPAKSGMPMEGGMMKMDFKMMDSNHDGMISRAEYNRYNTAMWTKMKKGKNGMVGMDDMQTGGTSERK